MILLVVGEECLCDGLSNCVDLVAGSSTTNSDLDVHVLEAVASNQEDGLEHLQSQGLGFNQVQCLAIHTDASMASSAVGNSSCVLLLSEYLNKSFLLGTHL